MLRMRALVIAATTVAAIGMSIGVPSWAGGNQAKTLAAAKVAAHAATGCSIGADPQQSGSARYGIVNLSFGPVPRCESWQVWGYTGHKWQPLFAGLQNIDYHPLKIPGRVDVCKGHEYSIVRSGPSLSASVVGKVTSTLHTYSTQVVAQNPASDHADGLGWYKITWHGENAWVGSTRVIDPSMGCSSWNDHKILGY